MKLGLAAFATLACATVSLLAQPAEPVHFSRVALTLPACETPGLGADDLRGALALDLRDEGLSLAPSGEVLPSSDVLVSLETACDASSELTLHASFQGEHHTRRVDLHELPIPQRARALSLSLAELLSQFQHPASAEPAATVDAAEAEPAGPAAPAAEPPKPPRPAPSSTPPKHEVSAAPAASRARDEVASRPPPAGAHSLWQLSLGPELRMFQTTTLWGGHALVRRGALSVGLHLLTAQREATPGTVTILTPHASVNYAWSLGSSRVTTIEVGPRLGAGRTFMNAEPSATGRAASAQDVYLDAAAFTRLSLHFSRRWHATLGAELGYAHGPIGYADNTVIARTAGAFASLWLEADLEL